MDLYIRPGSSREKREEVIEEFYRKELKNQIPSLIDKWEQKMEIKD